MSKKKQSAAKRKKPPKKRPKSNRGRKRAIPARVQSKPQSSVLRLPSQGKVPAENVDLLTATFEEPEGTYHMKDNEYRDWWRATFDWASRSVVRPAGETEDEVEAGKLFELAAHLYSLGAKPDLGQQEDGFVHPLVLVVAEVAAPESSSIPDASDPAPEGME